MNNHESALALADRRSINIQNSWANSHWIPSPDSTIQPEDLTEHAIALASNLLPKLPINGSENASTEHTLTLHQMGQKNFIYKLDISSERSVIIVMSRGGEKLNRETRDDFSNLLYGREMLRQNGVAPFIPQVYALGRTDLVDGFAVEYLPDHIELNARSAHGKNRERLIAFHMNAKTPESLVYNMMRDHTSSEYEEDLFYRITNDLKVSLIRKLTLLYRSTRRVPKEFSIDAGDFMIDPTKQRFDPRLITVRGGFMELSEAGFLQWLSRITPDEDYNDHIIFDIHQIEEGYALGNEEFKSASQR